MNDFQEQLERSARRLRDRRNAALDVPPLPRRTRRGAWWWVAVGAAACLGGVVGWTARGPLQTVAPLVLARTDTVFVDRVPVAAVGPDTARHRSVPPSPARPVPRVARGEERAAPDEAPLPLPLPAEMTEPLLPAALSSYAPGEGRNVLADSVDYTIFVCM